MNAVLPWFVLPGLLCTRDVFSGIAAHTALEVITGDKQYHHLPLAWAEMEICA